MFLQGITVRLQKKQQGSKDNNLEYIMHQVSINTSKCNWKLEFCNNNKLTRVELRREE